MRLLDRYLLRELLVPLVYCLAGFLLLWLAFNLFTELDDLQDLKLQAGDIAEYYLVKMPEFLPVGLPVTLLLALLYTLTNLTRHNEITAIRTAGVSMWRLSAPYFVVGTATSIGLFALNEFWVAGSAERADRIKNRHTTVAKDPSETYLKHDLVFISPAGREWHAALYNQKAVQMDNVQVNWTQEDGARWWLYAERAIYSNGSWTFLNKRVYRDSINSGAAPVPVPQIDLERLPKFTLTPEQIDVEITMAGRLSLRNSANENIPVSEILDYFRHHPKLPRDIRHLLQTRLHSRLASPWVCLVVVFIALPFGAAPGRRNIFAGVAGSVFLCFGYFVLLQLCQALGTSGRIAPLLAAWLPNVIFTTTGAWLTTRVR